MTKRIRRSESTRVANRLWKYRHRMGFTQRQVAELLGCHSKGDISHYERGDKLPSLITGLKLEIVYRVPVAFLFPEFYATLKATIRAKEERAGGRSNGQPVCV